jgi:uncharacterized GH25 family protein
VNISVEEIKAMKKRAIFAAAAVLLTAVTAYSHDYWLEPEAFFTSAGSAVNVRLFVGEGLKSEEERPLQKERTLRFQMFSAGKVRDLLAEGQEGQMPVTRLSFGQAGNYLVAMERKAQPITLDAKKFTTYLAEEGLEAIIAERERLGEGNAEGRERYSRYLKLALQVGDRHDGECQRAVSQRLEIAPLSNPYALKIGDTLKARILFEGRPLAGAKVFTNSKYQDEIKEHATMTDKDGMVSLVLDRPGQWLIRLVHMRRCQGCADADWESFWGAYSFGLKQAGN